MKATLTMPKIEIALETAIMILQSDKPVVAYRTVLTGTHGIVPESITEYDVERLQKDIIVGLGEREYEKLNLPKSPKQQQQQSNIETESTP